MIPEVYIEHSYLPGPQLTITVIAGKSVGYFCN